MRKCLLALTLLTMQAMAMDDMLIDDFSDSDGLSALGTRWQAFTDRVMGGMTNMRASVINAEPGQALRLEGEVRLENNGGFLQARLPLDGLDAGAFEALRVRVRGVPGSYYIHLRTPECRRPWQYYRARLPVTGEWREAVIPLAAFEPESLSTPLNPERLGSLGVVAAGERFDALIEVSRIELVRETAAGSAGTSTGAGR